MKRTILFVGGGLEAVAGIRRARELGLATVVSDLNPAAPGMAIADHTILASTYDVEGTIAAAERHVREVGPIHGVLAVAADVPLTLAGVAAALAIPGPSLETGRLTSDKLAMKERLARDGVPVPWFAPLRDARDLEEIAARGRDLVIKPVDSRGSRGVQRLDACQDLHAAYDHSMSQSPSGRVMVEAYLEGPQISSESLVFDGACHTIGFSDRNYELLDRFAPFFIENGGDLPSHLPLSARLDLERVVALAARCLAVTHGTIKGDLVWSRGRPYVIEMAARLSGGFFCTREIPLNTGVDFIGAAILLALGDRPGLAEIKPKFDRFICQRYKFVGAGRVTSVSGADRARGLAGVEDLVVYVEPGDAVKPMRDSTARVAMVIASGASRQEAQRRAAAALEEIEILTTPLSAAGSEAA